MDLLRCVSKMRSRLVSDDEGKVTIARPDLCSTAEGFAAVIFNRTFKCSAYENLFIEYETFLLD
jgi:hypothetical protein